MKIEMTKANEELEYEIIELINERDCWREIAEELANNADAQSGAGILNRSSDTLLEIMQEDSNRLSESGNEGDLFK